MLPSAYDEEKRKKEAQALRVPKYSVAFNDTVSPEQRQAFMRKPIAPPPTPATLGITTRPVQSDAQRTPVTIMPQAPDYASMGSAAERRFARQNYQDKMQALGYAVQTRGQDVAATTTRRGQDLETSTALSGQGVTAKGQDLAHAVAVEQNRNRAVENANALSLGNERNRIDAVNAETSKATSAATVAKSAAEIKAAEQLADQAVNKERARQGYVNSLSSNDPAQIAQAKKIYDSFDNNPKTVQEKKNLNKIGTVKSDAFVYTVTPEGKVTFGTPPAPQAFGGAPPKTQMPDEPEEMTEEEWIQEQIRKAQEEEE